MWRLDVASEAELEIFEAALRYERERVGLGFRFDAQVNTVFARLLDNPFQFLEIQEGARRALVRDFPYGVFFTTEGELITVLAVLHLHRHPDTWKRRRRDTE
ncbi:MAG: type II toxin-antitoxin system RelE/ParE family toxin [Acidobacteria bacterium]|nr:type II toxin-antitoxin system RelE/ParE family toxin [Acidobacteriota bacterium]MCA1650100.1 type II toxin-antitoxin system RelE/ParE family toxin [Acidobacteriota bacterium]